MTVAQHSGGAVIEGNGDKGWGMSAEDRRPNCTGPGTSRPNCTQSGHACAEWDVSTDRYAADNTTTNSRVWGAAEWDTTDSSSVDADHIKTILFLSAAVVDGPLDWIPSHADAEQEAAQKQHVMKWL
eukprot:CAMPEP_0204118136 /NCGR_PEP_ID=MMETSP0361-20130328/6372_1 /ASSEMBLY_ACC=CAM_ASM_000343 /TAXON_ID=268821 /ORGANISM="Scrippsiella Hangoei, Strain SHTV-5" /LENGTH=126 /DNA_ID=CAMNT_0051069113 /DNA_START=269 /DNA_END=647 /DNA_ORIENTATION=-